MDSFLTLAEELQLKGLEGNSEPDIPEYPPKSFNLTERRADVNQKQNTPKKTTSSFAKFEKELVGAVMNMMPIERKSKPNSIIEPATMAKIESMIEKRVDGNYCTNCGYTSKHPGHMREHVEKHIEGLEYPCNSCTKILKSSGSLRDHIRRYCPSQKSA